MPARGQCKVCDQHIPGVSVCPACRYTLDCMTRVSEWVKKFECHTPHPEIEDRIRVYRERAELRLPLFEDKEKGHGILA